MKTQHKIESPNGEHYWFKDTYKERKICMNEIEKMYENAGIKPTKNWQSCRNCKLKTETRYDDWGEEYLTCKMLERPKNCPDAKEFYPPFTAEKQIELIKWCLDNYRGYIFDSIETEWFEEQLCAFINNIWQDLTEEEKQQVKGILG